MDRESSSKSSNKPVDDRPGRQLPPPRGSGGHGVNEMKANNVLFSDLNSVPSGQERSPRAVARATLSVAASWTQRAPSCSSWCLLWHLGSMGLVRCQMLLVAIHNVQFVDKATRAIMGRWHTCTPPCGTRRTRRTRS